MLHTPFPNKSTPPPQIGVRVLSGEAVFFHQKTSKPGACQAAAKVAAKMVESSHSCNYWVSTVACA